RIRRGAPRRSSRRPRTTRTRSGSPLPRSDSARRWAASRSGRSKRRTRCFSTAGADLKVGVLALQGDFEAHCKTLRRLGAEAVEVRTPEQRYGLDRLGIPGTETS